MASTVYKQLVDQKIDRFIDEYINARNLFTSPINGKIIHKGEFGVLREKIVTNFISHFIPRYSCEKLNFEIPFLIL